MEELKEWNKVHNLTSIKDDRDIVVKHLLDSCLYLTALGPKVWSVADVGSGAGFPGIPIKVMRPELEVFLIEPTKKKCTFLRHVIQKLRLEGITVIDLPVDQVRQVKVDAAVTRALFSVKDFSRAAKGIVNAGGVFVLSKGPKYEEELAGVKTGYKVSTVELPHSGGIKRYIIKVRQ